MSLITIQQTPEQAQLAFDVHTHAEIESVRLDEARLARGAALDPDAGPIALKFSLRARQLEAPEDRLRLEVRLGLEGHQQTKGAARAPRRGKPSLTVRTVWVVDYRLLGGYRPEARAVKAFKDGNAVFNCWPYFREFVQSSISRMNLPPLTIPLLRIMPKPSPREASRKPSPAAPQARQ